MQLNHQNTKLAAEPPVLPVSRAAALHQRAAELRRW